MTTATLTTWQKVKTFIWLGFGVSCLCATFVLWLIQSQRPQVQEVPLEIEIKQVIRPIQVEMVAFHQDLGNFKEEVPPIDMTKRTVAVGEHEAEFRGSKFISENNKAWTLQIMKVMEEDVIRAYLSKRKDRKKFQYFRLEDGKNSTQFVLTYGIYKDVKQTIDQTQKINFVLPDRVKVIPEKFSTYTTLVNDLGSDEMAQGTKLRIVVLKKVALPKLADMMPKEVPVTNTTHPLAGTTTIIRRQDESGQVKTQIERSQVERPKTAPKVDAPIQHEQSTTPTQQRSIQENQIIDPF